MESPKNTRKQGKHKMPLNISGGGGLGGVFLLGGVAAVAAIVSVSANRMRRKGPENKDHLPRTPPPSPEPMANSDLSAPLDLNGDQLEGLCVILKESSSPTYCHPRDETAEKSAVLNDSTSLVFADGLFHADKSTLDTSGRNKNPTYMDILLSDNAKTKDMELFTNNGSNLDKSKEDVKIEAPPCNVFEEENSRRELIGKELEEVGQRLSGLENNVKRGEVNETDKTNHFAGEGNQDISKFLQKPMEEEAEVEGESDAQMKPVKEEQEVRAESIEENSEGEILVAQEDRTAIESDKEAIEVEEEPEVVEVPEGVEIEENDDAPMQLMEKDNPLGNENVSMDEVVAEEHTPPLLTEEENNDEIDVDDYDDEETSNKSEAGSDRTEDSSAESNIDAIWPEETIEELATESKEFKINDQEELEEDTDKYRNVEQKEYGFGDRIKDGDEKNVRELLERINLSTGSTNLSIRNWSIAVPLMLVVVVALHLLLSPALIGKLCIVVLFAAILSQV